MEDMHWADRSTQELVAAVARTAHGRLLVVVTVRNDDCTVVTRSAPPWRAGTHRIRPAGRLGPLDHRDRGAGPPAVRDRRQQQSVTTILERSEGNPLYAEELIAADPGAVPEHLADLLLARVGRLPVESRGVVRTASADGSRLDMDVLAPVTGLDAEALEGLLRQALDGHVLRQRGDVLEFRHGLLREAVYDDLLPGERTRTHAAFAEALQARVDEQDDAPLSSSADWPSTGRRRTIPRGRWRPRCAPASGRALRHGRVRHASRTCGGALGQRDDPEVVTERTKPDLLLLLAAPTLDNERRELFEALPGGGRRARTRTDRLVASRVYATLARAGPRSVIGSTMRRRSASPWSTPGRPPVVSWPRRSVAVCLPPSARPRRSCLEAAEQAARVARQAEDPLHEIEALHFCAIELDLLGRVEEALPRGGSRPRRPAGWSARPGPVRGVQPGLVQLVSGRPSGLRAGDHRHRGGPGERPRSGRLLWRSGLLRLVWHGRFEDAARLFGRLDSRRGVALGLAGRAAEELAVARGDLAVIARARRGAAVRGVRLPSRRATTTEVDQRVTGLMMLDRPDVACELAGRSWPSPRTATRRFARRHRRTRRPGRPSQSGLTPADACGRAWARERPRAPRGPRGTASAWLWLRSTAPVRGEPAATGLREALMIAERFGAFVALEPRLMLAEELLAHGERDEGGAPHRGVG